MSLTHFSVSQSNTSFTFFSSILIFSSPTTTPRNPTSLIFYLHFSGFTYKLFSSNLFTTSATILSCHSSSCVPTITSSIKAATFPIFIKSLSNLFIMVQNMAGEFINPKNITMGSKDPSEIVKAAFHSSPSLILTLL